MRHPLPDLFLVLTNDLKSASTVLAYDIFTYTPGLVNS
jgi:hypothetical protein